MELEHQKKQARLRLGLIPNMWWKFMQKLWPASKNMFTQYEADLSSIALRRVLPGQKLLLEHAIFDNVPNT